MFQPNRKFICLRGKKIVIDVVLRYPPKHKINRAPEPAIYATTATNCVVECTPVSQKLKRKKKNRNFEKTSLSKRDSQRPQKTLTHHTTHPFACFPINDKTQLVKQRYPLTKPTYINVDLRTKTELKMEGAFLNQGTSVDKVRTKKTTFFDT